MKTVIRENTWLNREFSEFGWGNGYVLLSPEHKFYKKYCDFIDQYVSIHGGLTFAALVNEDLLITFGLSEKYFNYWMIGFDTCHCDDTLENWTKERVQKETNKLAEQLEQIK